MLPHLAQVLFAVYEIVAASQRLLMFVCPFFTQLVAVGRLVQVFLFVLLEADVILGASLLFAFLPMFAEVLEMLPLIKSP